MRPATTERTKTRQFARFVKNGIALDAEAYGVFCGGTHEFEKFAHRFNWAGMRESKQMLEDALNNGGPHPEYPFTVTEGLGLYLVGFRLPDAPRELAEEFDGDVSNYSRFLDQSYAHDLGFDQAIRVTSAPHLIDAPSDSPTKIALQGNLGSLFPSFPVHEFELYTRISNRIHAPGAFYRDGEFRFPAGQSPSLQFVSILSTRSTELDHLGGYDSLIDRLAAYHKAFGRLIEQHADLS